MNKFTVDILEPTVQLLEISTSFINNINNLEIERSENFNIEIVNTEKILWSDLPDNIPISKISGNLHYTRIDGLEAYISSFSDAATKNVRIEDLLWGQNNVGLDGYLDQYEFDCGSP
jgi:hypothetical protein